MLRGSRRWSSDIALLPKRGALNSEGITESGSPWIEICRSASESEFIKKTHLPHPAKKSVFERIRV